ncbi:Catabolite control protein A [Streptococcus mitis]|uniref:Catabolite control protein A n=1 Tax=Streptococcus mitis TaxID=28037 RepID=A0A139PNG5_STRMT|nr:Catabolite control protein A [Streptococcus mitis]
MEKGKKVTIYDIARLSGFSPKTVSRVINGGNRVKPETYNAIKKSSMSYPIFQMPMLRI